MAWLDKVRWVFAYGSLIWNPEIPVRRGLLARVDGYHRRFCISSTRFRGTPEQPGVVLGLDRGGSCRGMAWELRKALGSGNAPRCLSPQTPQTSASSRSDGQRPGLCCKTGTFELSAFEP
ncbi:MAG: hypothetical protein EBU15_04595 [Betaproteobacteria bacterium]|nr:hypothetical protein [Betaproteobacteria bacterium]